MIHPLRQEIEKILTGMDLHHPSAVEQVMPGLLALIEREKAKARKEAVASSWEYRYQRINAFGENEMHNTICQFGEWGRDGWELCTIYDGNCFMFKRPTPNEPRV